MNHHRTLFEFAKKLQLEHDLNGLPRLILERLVEHAACERGLIVTREGGDFHERHHVRFDREEGDEQRRRFCRGLVRECIREARPIFTTSVAEDQRFKDNRSSRELGEVSILVTPLIYLDQVQGVIYLEKPAGAQPFDDREREFAIELVGIAAIRLHQALERESLIAFKQGLERDLFANYDFGDVIGRHPKMVRLLDQVARIAGAEATVLIRGETGTGKEMIARAVYLNSARKRRPFVTLHCGALPESLFEAELFGHKRGAFTGAVRDRAGRIAQADGGVLFIDEVAEMPPSAQAKLLRFFQFGEFQRIGADRVETVDVRILTATHRDLEAMVADGSFREDLYYRLKVITLEIPPLRERRSDITELIAAFLKKHWRRPDKPELSPRAEWLLKQYDYPGNVRELNHIIERMCILANGSILDERLLPDEILAEAPDSQPNAGGSPFGESALTNEDLKAARQRATENAVADVEIAFLETLLQRHRGNVAEAAEAAGMQITYFYKLMRKHGVKKPT
jgi:Nif-specific regulatory protein/two-component system response regulator HydG